MVFLFSLGFSSRGNKLINCGYIHCTHMFGFPSLRPPVKTYTTAEKTAKENKQSKSLSKNGYWLWCITQRFIIVAVGSWILCESHWQWVAGESMELIRQKPFSSILEMSSTVERKSFISDERFFSIFLAFNVTQVSCRDPDSHLHFLSLGAKANVRRKNLLHQQRFVTTFFPKKPPRVRRLTVP